MDKEVLSMNTIFTDRWNVYLAGLREALKTKSFLKVLETGRIHDSSDAYFYGDGASTLLFANQACIDVFYSIDQDEQSESICNHILGEAGLNVNYINKNSILAIPELKSEGPFDVVLLDSGENKILNFVEFLLCWENGLINKNSVILLDDIESKSILIMKYIEKFGEIITQTTRCSAIKVIDFEGLIREIKTKYLELPEESTAEVISRKFSLTVSSRGQ